MAYAIERDKIFREVDTLNRVEQLNLLAYIANALAKPQTHKYNLTDLKGLGKGLWTKNGIDNFISKERDSW